MVDDLMSDLALERLRVLLFSRDPAWHFYHDSASLDEKNPMDGSLLIVPLAFGVLLGHRVRKHLSSTRHIVQQSLH